MTEPTPLDHIAAAATERPVDPIYLDARICSALDQGVPVEAIAAAAGIAPVMVAHRAERARQRLGLPTSEPETETPAPEA